MTDTSLAEQRPYVPRPQGLNLEFYRHCAGGHLHVRACSNGHTHHPPRYRCPDCGSSELGWVSVAGSGTLHSWVVIHRATDPGWAARVPYVVGVAQLTEGPRVVGIIDGIAADNLMLDMPIDVTVDVQSEDFALIVVGPPGGRLR